MDLFWCGGHRAQPPLTLLLTIVSNNFESCVNTLMLFVSFLQQTMDLDYIEKVKENQKAAEERTAKRRKKRLAKVQNVINFIKH